MTYHTADGLNYASFYIFYLSNIKNVFPDSAKKTECLLWNQQGYWN